MYGNSLKFEYYVKRKIKSELLESLGFSREYIEENIYKYKEYIEKLIFELLDLEFRDDYTDDHIFILDYEALHLYEYSDTVDYQSDLKINRTIFRSTITNSFPVILAYIDSCMIYDEIYSYDEVENEFFDDYFFDYIQKKLELYFDSDKPEFINVHAFLDKILRLFLGCVFLFDEMEYSELKGYIDFTVKESFSL